MTSRSNQPRYRRCEQMLGLPDFGDVSQGPLGD